METMNNKPWTLLDKMRGQAIRHTAFEVLKEAKAQGIDVSFDDLRSLILRDGQRSGAFVLPEHIADFVISYFKNHEVNSVLDCWAHTGELLLPLAQKYKPAAAVGLNQNVSEGEVAQWMDSEHLINWQVGESFKLVDGLEPHFDAVLGFPPFNMRRTSLRFQLGDAEVNLSDDYSNLLLLKASLLLTKTGSAVFVVPSSFMFKRGESSVFSNLHRFGLSIDAALHLPNGTFAPIAQISGYLIIIRRETKPKLFVGELAIDPNQRGVLLGNLNARKEGKSPQLGALVEVDSFLSFPALVSEHETKNLARTLGLPSIRLIDICTSVNLPKRKSNAEFVEISNSVYLPSIGNSPAVASLPELKIKPQNYIQLVIHPEKAIAAYLAQFLNTPLGRKIRESLTSGFIPEITKPNLSSAVIYLPDLNTQIEVISTHSTLTDISSTLETLSRELWRHPRKYKEVQKRVKSMQPGDDFKKWIESLPFPIGSILGEYKAKLDVEDKKNYLFLFFEALSEFLAILMQSAYAQDTSFYAQESGAWIDHDPKYKDWLLNSSFGGWCSLGERLSKVTRRLLEDKDKREICARLFGNPSPEFLEMITNKKLFSILRDVNDYRNQWKGHTGALGIQDHQQHLSLLESKLSEMRKVMQDRWESALLLSPQSSVFNDGIFEYKVKALIGTNSRFDEVRVSTLTPMDVKDIYILHAQQQHPMKLQPFIRLMESPKTQADAIYFYNRMIGDSVRWVSYHFDRESEIIRPDSAVSSAIKLLQPPIGPANH